MFCPECGSKLDDDAAFCTECGAKIDSSSDVTEAMEQVEVADDPVAKTQVMPQVRRAERVTTVAPEISQDRTVEDLSERKGVNKNIVIGAIIAGIVVIAVAVALIIVFVVLPPNSGSSSPSIENNTVNTETSSSSSSSSSDADASSMSSSSSSSSSAAASSSPYLLPNSNSAYLTEADLVGMTNEELYFARNEIYARLGRQFKNADLQNYFNSQPWYQPLYSPEEFDSKGPALNDYERKNAELIMSVERSHGSPYLN